MGVTKDVFVRGYQFDGTTGLHSGEQLEDLVTRATPADGSEMVDQTTIETYLDAILNIYRMRIKNGSITADKIADGAITNAKLAEGFTMIKSVQRGSGTVPSGTTLPVLISAVNPAKSLVFAVGGNGNGTQSLMATFTDATNITVINQQNDVKIFNWQVIEYI